MVSEGVFKWGEERGGDIPFPLYFFEHPLHISKGNPPLLSLFSEGECIKGNVPTWRLTNNNNNNNYNRTRDFLLTSRESTLTYFI